MTLNELKCLLRGHRFDVIYKSDDREDVMCRICGIEEAWGEIKFWKRVKG